MEFIENIRVYLTLSHFMKGLTAHFLKSLHSLFFCFLIGHLPYKFLIFVMSPSLFLYLKSASIIIFVAFLHVFLLSLTVSAIFHIFILGFPIVLFVYFFFPDFILVFVNFVIA